MREIRTLRVMWRELETELRQSPRATAPVPDPTRRNSSLSPNIAFNPLFAISSPLLCVFDSTHLGPEFWNTQGKLTNFWNTGENDRHNYFIPRGLLLVRYPTHDFLISCSISLVYLIDCEAFSRLLRVRACAIKRAIGEEISSS